MTTMTASQRGLKHVCSECACKYYDLGTKGALCPKCGGQEVATKLRASGRPVRKSARNTFGHFPQSQVGGPGRNSTANSKASNDGEPSELDPKQ